MLKKMHHLSPYILDPSVEFLRCALLNREGRSNSSFIIFLCGSCSRMVLMCDATQCFHVCSHIGRHMWSSLCEAAFWNRENRHGPAFRGSDTCRWALFCVTVTAGTLFPPVADEPTSKRSPGVEQAGACVCVSLWDSTYGALPEHKPAVPVPSRSLSMFRSLLLGEVEL